MAGIDNDAISANNIKLSSVGLVSISVLALNTVKISQDEI